MNQMNQTDLPLVTYEQLKYKYNRIWLISDTHFLHKNIIEYCNRPVNFNSLIIKNWNKLVGDDDLVIHLGDVTFGLKTKELIEKANKILSILKGHKVLLRGNHDSFKPIKKNGVSLRLEDYFDILSFLIIEYQNKRYFLNHYPLCESSFESEELLNHKRKLASIFKEADCGSLIHGHVHNNKLNGNFLINAPHFNCSVEVIDYTPVELEKCLV